jgi:hypothetical protein
VSNKLGSNPMLIDTPDAVNALTNAQLSIRRLEYTNYNSVTDGVVVQDGNGNPIWQTRGNLSYLPVSRDDIGPYNGLRVPTMDSGVLLVYYR